LGSDGEVIASIATFDYFLHSQTETPARLR